MEGKKMDKLQRDLDTVDTYIERARKMLSSAHLQLACASAILDSLADDVEIGADLIASDTTSCSGDSSSGDRE
jgi:hypothetical protein